MVSINGMPYGYIAVRDDFDDQPVSHGKRVAQSRSPIIRACKKHIYAEEFSLVSSAPVDGVECGYTIEVEACVRCARVRVKRWERK